MIEGTSMCYAVLRLNSSDEQTLATIRRVRATVARTKDIDGEVQNLRDGASIILRGCEQGILDAMDVFKEHLSQLAVSYELEGPHGSEDDDLLPEEEAHQRILHEGMGSL